MTQEMEPSGELKSHHPLSFHSKLFGNELQKKKCVCVCVWGVAEDSQSRKRCGIQERGKSTQ